MYKKNTIYEDKKDSNKEMFAIMIEKSEGRYVEYRSSNWPRVGYSFAEAKCVDRDKNNLGNLVTYDARTNTAIMKSTSTSFCTLYFRIDNVAPVVSAGSFYIGSSKEQVYTNNVNEEIHIKVDDDDVIEYCLINEKNPSMCEWRELPELSVNREFIVTDYDLGSDGEKTVYLYLKDGAMNISDVVEDSIILDTEAPSCTNSGDSTTWTKDSRTIYWGCSDTNSGCNSSFSGGSTIFSTTTQTSEILAYTIQDNAGNIRICQKRTANVYVDKTAPSCTNSGDSTTWTKNDRTIYWGCNDTNSGCNSSYNGGSKTFDTTTRTSNIAAYEIRDIAGNKVTCDGRSANVYVDKTAPSLTVVNKANGSTYTGGWTKYTVNSNLTFSDSESGIKANTLEWGNDGNTWSSTTNTSTSTYSGTWEAERNGKGYYKICDVAGNCTTSNFDLKIDKTAPSCSISEGSGTTSKKLTGSGSDSGEGTVYYSWDNNNNYSTTNTEKTVTTSGTYYLYVKDGVGNERSCSKQVTVLSNPYKSFKCKNIQEGSAPFMFEYTGDCERNGSESSWWFKFTSSGRLTVSGPLSVEFFLVGGGGQGGQYTIATSRYPKYDDYWDKYDRKGGAGGGGGGTKTVSATLVNGTNYDVTIGNGGRCVTDYCDSSYPSEATEITNISGATAAAGIKGGGAATNENGSAGVYGFGSATYGMYAGTGGGGCTWSNDVSGNCFTDSYGGHDYSSDLGGTGGAGGGGHGCNHAAFKDVHAADNTGGGGGGASAWCIGHGGSGVVLMRKK